MAASVVWHGDEFMGHLQRETVKRLKTSAELVKSMMVRKLSVSGHKGGQYTPSQPGEPPHADTGTLRKSIFWEVDETELKAIVGSPVHYSLHLELGTSRMAARPYMRITLQECMPRIVRIMTLPLPNRAA